MEDREEVKNNDNGAVDPLHLYASSGNLSSAQKPLGSRKIERSSPIAQEMGIWMVVHIQHNAADRAVKRKQDASIACRIAMMHQRFVDLNFSAAASHQTSIWILSLFIIL
ncbi:hypothetical protein QAD02_002025 [Eretmocerus hayati]|uniref:Uncharacterized protein n=1 Tax=Eretmocerus hayati TaxID=131215 RepID=A0ACC2NJF8_9HYME|nr:hypothetical protein QAD02_002025 [Eretmocerus hayati]